MRLARGRPAVLLCLSVFAAAHVLWSQNCLHWLPQLKLLSPRLSLKYPAAAELLFELRQRWARRPPASLVAAVLASPDILSQVMTHLGLLELDKVAMVSGAWQEAVVAARSARRVLCFERTLGRGKGSGGGELDLPFFVCSMPNRDCVLVADFFNHRLQTLSTAAGSSTHQVVAGWQQGVELSCPMGLVCDEQALLTMALLT